MRATVSVAAPAELGMMMRIGLAGNPLPPRVRRDQCAKTEESRRKDGQRSAAGLRRAVATPPGRISKLIGAIPGMAAGGRRKLRIYTGRRL
jgi:hypothetical protein